MSPAPRSHGVLSTFVAVAISILLSPLLLFLWFGLVGGFTSLFIVGRWDEASWWKPYGYYSTGAVFILLGVFLVIADINVGLRVGRSVVEETNDERS